MKHPAPPEPAPRNQAVGGTASAAATEASTSQALQADAALPDAALLDSESRFRFLTSLSDATSALVEPRRIMATVAELLGRHLQTSRCAYAEVEAGGDDFFIRDDYTHHCASTVGRYQLSLFGPRAVSELRANQTLVVHDVEAELAPDEGGAMFNAIGIQAIICCPLIKGGELRAMMAVHQTTPRRWSPSEISLVEEVVERCWDIIERARAEMVLRESKQRMDFIIGVAELGEWELNLDDGSTRRSPRHDLIFGYASPPPEWTLETFLDHVLPDDRAHVEATFRASVQDGTAWECEADIRRADGEVRSIWVRGRLLHPKGEGEGPLRMLGTVADITERRRDALALLERTRLAELSAEVGRALTQSDGLREMLHRCAEVMVERLDAAFARIWTLDHAGTMLELQASAGMYTHLDGPHGRVPMGQFKIGLIAQERRPHLTNQVLGDPRVSDQEWAAREGMVAFAGYPLVVEDRLLGVAALFARRPLTDATLHSLAAVADAIALGIERKRGEEERARLLESEQRARQEAEATNRIKDEFLATLSHELRTPLNAILGWTHMLRSGRLGESDAERALETIERNTRSQVQLIEDLLDVSRIISGKLRLEVRPIELAEVIHAAVDAVRPGAQAKEIRLQVLVDPHAGLVSGDGDRLQQVVWNLLSNAVKFTPKGGRIQLRLERVNSHVEIAVSDSGRGIEADFLPHIFDRFRQADGSSTRSHGGLGLGLSIVNQLVELHGGTVYAHSEGKDQGATFVVQLPCLAARPSPLLDSESESRRHPTADGSDGPARPDGGADDCPPALDGLRVLVVDDEDDNRSLLGALLERCGSQVMTARSASEGFEAFVSWHPEVLVSDIGMPGEDGYSLIRKVRVWEARHGSNRSRVPAVALTAYARTEDRVQALRAGFQVHVPKPIEPVELVAFVASLAGRTEL
jgi:signal transduction histidine kinase/PAS domain-containing protein/ActR/RegA family two-component response regulator